MGLFARRISCIGLDIGDHSIKIMEIRETGRTYEVANFGLIPTPPGIMEGNRIVDEDGAIKVLQNLSGQAGSDVPRVAMAVSGDNVIIRSITVPEMPDDELAGAVRFEAEALLPVPAEDVTIDYIKYDAFTEAGVRNQEVLIVAVRKDIVNKMARVAEAVGFEPVMMDIEPFALVRAIRKLNPALITGNDSFAVVNIGSANTNISVFAGDRLTFTRTLGFVGNRLSSLDAEIGRSLEYYMAQHRGQEIPPLCITGGGALTEGLAAHMSEELELPVSVFDPTEFLRLSGKVRHMEKQIREAGTALTKVVGLALSEV